MRITLSKMAKTRDRIISMRVSSQERENLTLICTRTGITMSELMR